MATSIMTDLLTYVLFKTLIGVEILYCDSTNYTTHDVVKLNGDCYVFIYEPSEFIQSMRFCKDIGGHLTDINNETQSQVMNFTAQGDGRDKDFWIGLVYTKAIENWIWLNGNDFSYTEQFTSDMAGNCVVIQTAEGGSWNNIVCSSKRPFICKIARQEVKECPAVLTNTTTTLLPYVNYTTTTTDNSTSTLTPRQNKTTLNGADPQEQKGGSQQHYYFIYILATVLIVSLMINIFFLVRCAIRCKKQSYSRKRSEFHVEMSKLSNQTSFVETNLVPLCTSQNSKSDLGQSKGKLGKSSTCPRGIKLSRMDSEKSECTMFLNELYYGQQVSSDGAQDGGIPIPKKMSSVSLTPSKKFSSLNDNDSTYDVPLSPTSVTHSSRKSVDDATNNENSEFPRRFRGSSTQSDSGLNIHLGESASEVISEENADSIIQFGDGRLELQYENEMSNESVYANTPF